MSVIFEESGISNFPQLKVEEVSSVNIQRSKNVRYSEVSVSGGFNK